MPSKKGVDEFGQKIKFDYDRAYATFNNNKELVTIQSYKLIYHKFHPIF